MRHIPIGGILQESFEILMNYGDSAMADYFKDDIVGKAEEVLENIFRIPVTLPDNPLKELNSYLIRDPERSLLIDTGFCQPACKEALLSGLGELGVDPASVDVFLTHLHADHSGLSSDIAGEDRRILISDVDGKWLENLPVAGERWDWLMTRYTLAGMPPEMVEEISISNPAIRYAPPRSAKYTLVNDGEVLNVGGYSLQCILTPGHTPGHMCLWDKRLGLMFTGDHILFDITPNITAWPSTEDSLGDYLDSLRMISEYPVKTALPGHRKPGDFHKRIGELILHHNVRLAEVESIISSEPGLTVYAIAGKMRWKIRSNNWDEFPISQKIFAVGECLSHLDYLRIRGIIECKPDGKVNRYHKCV